MVGLELCRGCNYRCKCHPVFALLPPLMLLQELSFATSRLKLLLQTWARQAAGIRACSAELTREREGLQTSRSHMETLPHTYYKEAKNVACLPRGEYRCWWTMKTQIKGRDWGHLKSVGGSLLKGAKSLWIVSISQLLNIWVYLPKLAKFNFSRIKKIDRFLVYF